MIITVEAVLATDPCPSYPPERIRALVGDGLDPADPATLEIVLALPPADARWVLSRLLSPADAVVWAQACADRALGYSDAGATRYYACYASEAASVSTARYAAAAEAAAHYSAATYAARYHAEHKTACQHALALLASS